MINMLETVIEHKDTWRATFYYVSVLILLSAIFWTYMQIFVLKQGKKKVPLKENVIYQNSEDIIENYNAKEIAKKSKAINRNIKKTHKEEKKQKQSKQKVTKKKNTIKKIIVFFLSNYLNFMAIN